MNRLSSVLTPIALVASLAMTGCSLTRYDRLVAKADKVESNLKSEQRKALTLDQASPERAAKLDHLTGLRNQLSAANVGLSTVRHALPADKKDIGYDVLDQVYDTIDWNIPLAPTDPAKKPLPSAFSGGVLKLN
jgi:hypothetical protein